MSSPTTLTCILNVLLLTVRFSSAYFAPFGTSVRRREESIPLPMEGRYSHLSCAEDSGACRHHALETLLYPHSGLLKTSRLCPKTLLVSLRLGEGAATRDLVTHHQEDERERQSNQRQGLRA